MSARAGVLVLALALGLAAGGAAAQPPAQPAPQAAKPAKPAARAAAPEMMREQRALDILKAAGDRLAAARTMGFTATATLEYPSRLGPPLAFTTAYDVLLERPDRLRVITLGDGPATEFYYDGKSVTVFAPAENLVATAAAPPTIDGALKFAFDTAGIYFLFTDLIVADPYKGIADGMRLAFYIGQSQQVGGVTTDMVAYANDDVFVQLWIGAEDRLPRRVRAVYRQDPDRLRHQLDLANWRIDDAVPREMFASARAAAAAKIDFASPRIPKSPAGAKPAAKGKPAAPAAPKAQ